MAPNECDTFLRDSLEIIKNINKLLIKSKNMNGEVKEDIKVNLEQLKEMIINENHVFNSFKSDILNKVIENNERHNVLLNDLTQQLMNKNNVINDTYAKVTTKEMVKHGNGSNYQPQHVVIVKPVDKNGTSSDTEKIVKSTIKPCDLNIGVKRVNEIANGGIVVECRNEEECDKLINEIGIKTKRIIASKPIKKKPRLVVKGVRNDIDENDLIELLINNNLCVKEFLEGKEAEDHISLKFKFRRKSRDGDNMFCLEVSPEMRQIIFKNQKLFIEWNSCSYEDFLPIIRCFKCNAFGHMQNKCTQSDNSCGHCGQNHKTIECKVKDRNQYFCLNCDKFNRKKNQKQKYDTNHSSLSPECKRFAEIKQKVLVKINV
jgi:hypothetical protein